MTTGMRISQIIADSGMSQKEFSEKLGLSTSTMSRIVNDAQELNKAAKLILQDQFNVNLEWLETGQGRPYLQKEDMSALTDQLASVLSDNPAILKLVSEVSARMTAADWRKLNDFIDYLGGVK